MSSEDKARQDFDVVKEYDILFLGDQRGDHKLAHEDALRFLEKMIREDAARSSCAASEETRRRAEDTIRLLADDDAEAKADKAFWRGRARYLAEQILRATLPESGQINAAGPETVGGSIAKPSGPEDFAPSPAAPTPRTDAALEKWHKDLGAGGIAWELCRQLERELTHLKGLHNLGWAQMDCPACGTACAVAAAPVSASAAITRERLESLPHAAYGSLNGWTAYYVPVESVLSALSATTPTSSDNS